MDTPTEALYMLPYDGPDRVKQVEAIRQEASDVYHYGNATLADYVEQGYTAEDYIQDLKGQAMPQLWGLSWWSAHDEQLLYARIRELVMQDVEGGDA